MYEKAVKIQSEHGVHARPASELVKMTNRYESKVVLVKGDIEVNGKSIMGILMLAIAPNDEIVVRAEGPDEQELVDAIIDLIEHDFYLQ